MHTPPNGHVWHKAFFWWVQVQDRIPHAPGISKNAYGPIGIPLIEDAPGAGRWPPLEGGKSLGESPLRPKEISRYRYTLGQIRAADNTAGRSATLQLERFRPILICGISCSPHLTGKCGTRHFLCGSGHRAGAHTRPAFPKMSTAPSVFPLLGAPQARSVPQITRPAEVLPGNWRGSDRDWSASCQRNLLY